MSVLSKPQAPQGEATVAAASRWAGGDRKSRKGEENDDSSYWFERGARLDGDDPAAAEAAYRNAIAAAPASADAYLNLGCLLCNAGRSDEAISLYRTALRHCPAEALLHFNLAIALEDRGNATAALACYEKSLQLSPDFSDAHYNAALVCEQLGQASKAIKHLSAVRRLQKS